MGSPHLKSTYGFRCVLKSHVDFDVEIHFFPHVGLLTCESHLYFFDWELLTNIITFSYDDNDYIDVVFF